MASLINLIGADRIGAGNDFPRAAAVKRRADVVDSIPGHVQRERETILCDNPAQLPGI